MRYIAVVKANIAQAEQARNAAIQEEYERALQSEIEQNNNAVIAANNATLAVSEAHAAIAADKAILGAISPLLLLPLTMPL